MDKEENYSASITGNFPGLDYSIDHHHHHHHQQQQLMAKTRIGETSGENSNQIVDYMLHNPQPHHIPSGFYSSTSPDKLSFADVMQFADFGPKLGLNQTKITEEETGIDPVYFLKFPVLNDRLQDDDESLMVPQGVGTGDNNEDGFKGMRCVESSSKAREGEEQGSEREDVEEGRGNSGNSSVQLQILGENLQKNPVTEVRNKRKRPRTIKTSEEVESQRMTHIAVERNRRKQMNEHLRVLRSLMPGSYVQRGDQASIIGGAIEFVRELEQLLQCLESQKRRRLYGDPPPPPPRPLGDDCSLGMIPQPPQMPPFFPPVPLLTPNHDHQIKHVDFETAGGGGGLLQEETAESKSCLADVEVKMLGFDAIIKILSRRRPGQLIKTISALEDLQLNILHTNITTIEQTVLYSFNVKVGSEGRFSAEEIASSVQQIFSFIHANCGL